MIYSLNGIVTAKNEKFVVIETAAGIGFKASIAAKTHNELPAVGESVKVFCATAVTREGIDLYAFPSKKELDLFDLFTSVNGIGPKGALKIMSAGKPEEVMAAIYEGRADLLVKVGGIGEKKAARIILEMKGKLKDEGSEGHVTLLEVNNQIEDALHALGFKKEKIKEVLKKIAPSIAAKEDRLKEALRVLGKK